MFSKSLENRIIRDLQAFYQGNETIEEISSVGGGSINQCFQFSYGSNKFFLKINSVKKFPGMMSAEAKGLHLLRSAETLVIPQVILQGEEKEEQFLLLEFLERKPNDASYYFDLGKGLALQHKQTQKKFGLDHNNYIGSLPQDNFFCETWNEFFICRKIEPLLKQAIDSSLLPKVIHKNFGSLFVQLNSIFPTEEPSLLHGDLWNGNVMNSIKGPCIFDPAVYYGHREADIAMTRLFGGFDKDFYKSYDEEYPLEKDWEKRLDVFNLYPLLVHAILFGGAYSSDVHRIAKRF